jgi:hypothetical protein
MSAVNISQLWGRAWDLFKVNWLLLVGLLVLAIIASLIAKFIPFVGALIGWILVRPVLVRAGYLVARQGQSSFGEAFRDLSLLLKVFAYDLILRLIPGILIGMGVDRVLESVVHILAAAPSQTEKNYSSMIDNMVSGGTGGVLIGAGLAIFFILYLFGWAGPYAILSGRAGIFSAISQSFSLTAQNFGKVFLAFFSLIVLAILGVILCGLGLLVVLLVSYVFWPLLYFALTGEEGASHA